MQDTFLTKISHEVRTPINAIIGLGFLFQQTRLEDKQRKYLDTIISSAENLLQTFQSILDYTGVEDSSVELQSLPFNMQVLLDNLSQTISLRCQEKGIQFSFTCTDDVPKMLVGDSIRISQIILNIALNAVKFTSKGGYVHIHVEMDEDDELVRFLIADTGIGIAEEWREKVFEPFMQIDNSHTRIFGGAGLGLATCKQLVLRMNGKISIQQNTTDEENPGCIFTVTLPLPTAEVDNITHSDNPLNGYKALIIDHDVLRTQALAPILMSFGMEAETSHHGEEALKRIAEADRTDSPFHFILITWQMPDMDGIEIGQYINSMEKRNSPAGLVLMSDYFLDDVDKLATESGFKSFIQTPANSMTYEFTLQDVLEIMQEEEAALAIPEQSASDGPVRILLVEDNEINQEIAYEVLTSAQYVVDIANNGQEAVDAVEKTPYGLILMDIQMPVMDGLEATKNIRAAGHKMPIIAMTAHSMADDKEISIAVGMNAHLTKPLEPMALFATMNTWLPAGATAAKKEVDDKEITITRKEKLPDCMEGFNLSSGLATVGGNETLYISLLRKFATRYADINQDISNCIQQNDFETAIRHAHTVKGIAANLGAEALANAAEALEKAIALAPNMTAPHLRTLVVRLSDAVAAISDNLGLSAASQEESEAIDEIADCLNLAEREHAKRVFNLSINHMENDWGHAVDLVNYFSERLDKTKVGNTLRRLKQALEDFDSELAKELKDEVISML